MKALRKKYGKRPWIDTPNAAWYRKRCNSVRFTRAIMLNAIGLSGHSQLQAIRSTPAAGAVERANKTMAMADLALSQTKAVNRIFEDYPMPDPNRPQSTK